jgi:hypothetical protein
LKLFHFHAAQQTEQSAKVQSLRLSGAMRSSIAVSAMANKFLHWNKGNRPLLRSNQAYFLNPQLLPEWSSRPGSARRAEDAARKPQMKIEKDIPNPLGATVVGFWLKLIIRTGSPLLRSASPTA